ncbi:MAG TPA: 6-phosphofructokinase [Bacillota bacterium]|nr:6-phosphofructokinase [Bacillota bacterium]
MQKIAVLTSGGDAPGMNAAIRAVARTGIYYRMEVYGIERGFSGLSSGSPMKKFSLGAVAGIIHRGGTILHTARAPDFKDRALQEKAVRCLRDAGIEDVVVIGGGGSFHGAQALQELGMKTVGIPATIDNDIPGTGSAIGFDTAVNTILDAINRLRDTATSHERIFIVEVMGRESGFIALAAGIAGGAEAIIVPEIKPDLDEICRRLLQGIARKKTHSLIIAAEGAASAYEVGKVVHERTGLETRVTVLGHIQRGGSPSAVDRLLGSRMGAVAVELLRRDCSGVMTALKDGDIVPVPLLNAITGKRKLSRDLYEMSKVLAL